MTEKKRPIAIEVKDVSISYRILNNVSIRKTLFHKKQRNEVFEAVKHVSFEVEEGGILGIIGKNGSGKSTLLRSMAGVFSPNSGTIDLHDRSVSLMALGVGFKPELTGRANAILSGMLLGFKEKEVEERMDSIIDFSEIGDIIDRPVRT
ncbi:MAG: ATP-binding cassette domain-containing protein, partial [Lachnospiraceae bacterium]|nr:ATP-binding cassette domain-containing protein [Lachnospiraceae bacterium]